MFEVKKNAKYAEMLEAYQKTGNAAVVEEWNKQVSSGGQGGFEEGDHIDWPDKLDQLMVKINGSTTAQPAILVQITNKSGVQRYQLFFISTFGKAIRELEVNDKKEVTAEKPFVRTKGTAAADYQNSANLDMSKTLQRMISEHPNGFDCTKVENPWTYKYYPRDYQGAKEVVKANLYTLDYTA